MQFNAPGLADYSGHFASLDSGDVSFGAGGSYFGRPDIVANLNKALGDGASFGTTSAAGPNGVNVLIPQSLETTLQVVGFKAQMLKLWQRIAKKPAYSTIEEYDMLKSFGQDELMWMSEGGLPNIDASEYSREVAQVRYLGTQRAVTHQMTLVNVISGIQNIIDREDRNGTLQLLRNLETALFEGDDRVDALSIKGIFQQIEVNAPKNVIDLRGKPITDAVLEDLDNRAADNYATIDTMFMDNRQKNNLSQFAFANKRFMIGNSGQQGQTNLGLPVERYIGNNSQFALESHQFIRAGVAYDLTFVPRVGAPAAPTSAALVEANNAASLLPVGTYSYAIVGVNSKGEGAEAVVTNGAAVDSSTTNGLTWVDPADAVYIKIYRRDTATGKYLFQAKVAKGVQAYNDAGQDVPGTSKAYALMMDGDEGMAWKQLAPLMKLPLAQIDTSIRWAILLYGTLMVYQPTKQFVFKNVGSVGIEHVYDEADRPRN
jgi:hypothetical protein